MAVSQFPCPHCSTNLRIKDRMFVGKIVGCPDCGEQLEIVADGPRKLAARKCKAVANAGETSPPEAVAKPANGKPRRKSGRTKATKPAAERKSKPSRTPVLQRIAAAIRNPVVMAWIVAVTATGTIVGVVVSRVADRRAVQQTRTADDAIPPADDALPPPPNLWEFEDAELQARLQFLGELLAADAEKNGEFLPGVVPLDGRPDEERFSWQATLAASSDEFGRRAPQWNRPWNDPVNEAFVRQRIPLFRNPSLSKAAGTDGLPAAHFAGVAGVGEDGPQLPANHPRAGIFASNRATKRRDVRDGLGNTMLVVGVRDRLGGWAHGGRSTIRPFTTEPYINGPDGFGTGREDRMMVLMADGSVREVSRKTSPVVVRRMAAMSDGFSLDPNAPGDPLDAPFPPKSTPGKPDRPNPVAQNPEEKQPGKTKPKRKRDDANGASRPPVVAARPQPGLRPADVRDRLAQRILAYRQPAGAELGDVIDELEELSGVAFRFGPGLKREELAGLLPADDGLQLEDVTVGEILTAVLNNVRPALTFVVERNGVLIRHKSTEAKP